MTHVEHLFIMMLKMWVWMTAQTHMKPLIYIHPNPGERRSPFCRAHKGAECSQVSFHKENVMFLWGELASSPVQPAVVDWFSTCRRYWFSPPQWKQSDTQISPRLSTCSTTNTLWLILPRMIYAVTSPSEADAAARILRAVKVDSFAQGFLQKDKKVAQCPAAGDQE